MLNSVVGWLLAHGLNATAIGAAIVFVFSVVQFVSVRARESRTREFEQYHLLIQRLVTPDEKGMLLIDRQVATVFELRHFPRYYECTERILEGLKTTWGKVHNPEMPRLFVEIDLTLRYIKKNRRRNS